MFYRIINPTTGAVLGVYPGATKAEALDAMARDVADGSDVEAEPADYVSAGVGEDADYGRVLSVDGNRVTVGWLGSESRTTVGAHRLTFHATLNEARDAAE